jgi:hypothetical protein
MAVTTGRFGEPEAGIAESAEERQCRQSHAATSGQRVERGSNYFGIVMRACGLTRLFATAAAQAGVELTRSRLTSSLERITAFRDPALLEVGSFGPGKHDAANTVRTLRWGGACRCWTAQGGVRRAPA